MIRLSEIKRENDVVSAVVTTVELSPRVFRVAYNLATNEVVENTLGKMGMNVNMAIRKLIILSKEYGYDLPDSAESVWYWEVFHMTVRDLFNFIYQNLEERKLMESILTIVDCYPEGRGARIHHGFVNPKEVSLSDLDSEIASGYYV